MPAPESFFRDNGTDYLLRTYLPGETLTHYRDREGTCPEAVCVSLGRQICRLLETLHTQQPPIIHRDIKPENILLLPDGRVGLIDFGIARQYKSGQDTDTRRMGTRSTAAPEQYGFAQTDHRTDLYALGMTLIWLSTGTYERRLWPRHRICPRISSKPWKRPYPLPRKIVTRARGNFLRPWQGNLGFPASVGGQWQQFCCWRFWLGCSG